MDQFINVDRMMIRSFKAGEWVFHEGDIGDCAYLVETGEVQIVLERGSELIPLVCYGEGSLFGEMSIIGDQPRSASAFAQSDCKLRKISREQINRRLEQADPILKVCMSVLIGHLKKSLAKYDEKENAKPELSLDEKLRLAADRAVKPSMQVQDDMSSTKEQPKMTIPSAKSEVVKADPLSQEMFKQALYTINLENDLDKALKDEELVLFYQPIIEANTGRLAGFEALMRWIHPDRGMISPGDFIPVAERSGQMVAMTHWAVEQACQDLCYLRDLFLASVALSANVSEKMFMSVNFSSRDFLDSELMDKVQQLLKNYDLPKNSLKIEVTESVLVSSPREVTNALNNCREHGASVAIDDFGTGYSSLSYLQTLPADTLKIDQAFIRPMHNDERHMALVESIIHLAQRLDMVTVAEGVETELDAQSLASLQCDYLQGYYFARPMPAQDIIRWANDKWGED
uniref:FOG: eal domain-protein n=1 Tax=uncultured delta proteobacterium HF0010_08B07 TaxID=710821 RepID=E0XWV3_9DELT|nr:FOG: eal domain-protein [uncultured delta proteobacterium HF0010_08B07]